MRVFSFIPCYLSLMGDGLHERKLAEELNNHMPLCVAAFRILTPHLDAFGDASLSKTQNAKVLLLPTVRPLFLFSFIYGALFALIFSFCRMTGKRLFDVIYVRDTMAGLSLNLLKPLHGTPVALKLESFVFDEYFIPSDRMRVRLARWILSAIEKVIVKNSDRIFVPSNLFKYALVARHRLSPSKISAQTVGVDIERFSNVKVDREDKRPFTLGYFGSLAKLNDVDCLLESIGLLRSRGFIKLILSTHSNSSYVKKKTEEMCLNGEVEILGTPHELIPKLMSEVDAIVVPRRKLSSTDFVLPLKLLEAGAATKPVIIARTRIVEFELEDGEQVLMYEPQNPKDLAAKILHLQNDKGLQENLGKRLFDYVRAHDWSIIGANFIRILSIEAARSKSGEMPS